MDFKMLYRIKSQDKDNNLIFRKKYLKSTKIFYKYQKRSEKDPDRSNNKEEDKNGNDF